MSYKHTDPRRDTLDRRKFAADVAEPETKYGLPRNVMFCSECVISNQRPNSAVEYKHTKESTKQTIQLDDDGVCDACKQARRKAQIIDWDRRRHELTQLCDKYRSRNGSYDCIVPGSGG